MLKNIFGKGMERAFFWPGECILSIMEKEYLQSSHFLVVHLILKGSACCLSYFRPQV